MTQAHANCSPVTSHSARRNDPCEKKKYSTSYCETLHLTKTTSPKTNLAHLDVDGDASELRLLEAPGPQPLLLYRHGDVASYASREDKRSPR